ncbi:MAG: serine hydrolase domain-containing protein, partial [Bryobacteraceae bacterium]
MTRRSRREFLAGSAQLVGSLSLSPLLGCSSGKEPSTEPKQDSARAGHIADLEKRIPQLLSELRVPGVSIAIIGDAKVAWSKGFGIRDVTLNTPVENNTIFEAQSMSKPVFAYAVMKLCERGVLNLDTPLTTYTPDRFVKDDSMLDLITARHVLSHTTGFPNWRSQRDPLRINFTPGEKWSYSGEGYYYLQSIMTRLTGHTDPATCAAYEQGYRVCATDFNEYMSANLLLPFAMTSSGYLWTGTFEERMARPHDKNGTPLKKREANFYGCGPVWFSRFPAEHRNGLREVSD